jgi:hypothetical protein
MAKVAPQKAAVSTDLRFVMLEADIPRAELGRFIHAIQKAAAAAARASHQPQHLAYSRR